MPKLTSTAKKDFIFTAVKAVNSQDFTSSVKLELTNWINMLADMDTKYSYQTLQAQFRIIAGFSETDQLRIISNTIECGWKSLRYQASKLMDDEANTTKLGKSVAANKEDETDGEVY